MKRKLHTEQGMKYQIDWRGVTIVFVLLCLFLGALFIASYIDVEGERQRLSELEQDTIGLLNGVTMRTGPNDYVTCRQVRPIPGVDETGI